MKRRTRGYSSKKRSYGKKSSTKQKRTYYVSRGGTRL